ncbi:hypothetical protein H5410_030803 [Solanum commersonii]|uniref:Uncharacterized protein n=1 Tax=Solanum commersonii TaxID=4109 RepID=A0A9J5YGR2_SOLCO|nr:hypothetical protein H5410_030803 [Solanum commersonii]
MIFKYPGFGRYTEYIVESICIEHRKMLLFFWTSIKSLPLEALLVLIQDYQSTKPLSLTITCHLHILASTNYAFQFINP